jgi:hypothetical protein
MVAFKRFVLIGFRHATVLTPSMFVEHEPHIPSLHDLLNHIVESCSVLIFIRTSKTYKMFRNFNKNIPIKAAINSILHLDSLFFFQSQVKLKALS